MDLLPPSARVPGLPPHVIVEVVQTYTAMVIDMKIAAPMHGCAAAGHAHKTRKDALECGRKWARENFIG